MTSSRGHPNRKKDATCTQTHIHSFWHLIYAHSLFWHQSRCQNQNSQREHFLAWGLCGWALCGGGLEREGEREGAVSHYPCSIKKPPQIGYKVVNNQVDHSLKWIKIPPIRKTGRLQCTHILQPYSFDDLLKWIKISPLFPPPNNKWGNYHTHILQLWWVGMLCVWLGIVDKGGTGCLSEKERGKEHYN